jgi:hypothetical protein
MKTALKNPSANCLRKFKGLQLTFQVVTIPIRVSIFAAQQIFDTWLQNRGKPHILVTRGNKAYVMTNERVVGRSLADLKSQKALFEALRCAQWLKNEREMILVFHQNGRSTASARLIAPGSRLVGFGPTPVTPPGPPRTRRGPAWPLPPPGPQCPRATPAP